MYETFYQFTEPPFRLMPDPKYCFSHSGYAKAHAYLQYAFEQGEGFIILTGRPGTGKTTLIESFLAELETANVATANIAVADPETTDLLRCVAFAYGIEDEGLDKVILLRRIAQHFATLMHRGQRVLLIIDEAQGLSHSALEELRLLADLQEGVHPLVQIFLVGQEKLRSLMRESGMEQFQQRVIGTCQLGPMGLAETKDYVRHRLCQAGWTGDPELTGAAILAIYQYSVGIPRHVNKICTRLLLVGFMEHKHLLDKDDVLNIALEMDEEQLAPVSHEQSTPELAAEDDDLASALQDHSESLTDLAVRVQQHTGDKQSPSAPSKVKKNEQSPIPPNSPTQQHAGETLSLSVSPKVKKNTKPPIPRNNPTQLQPDDTQSLPVSMKVKKNTKPPIPSNNPTQQHPGDTQSRSAPSKVKKNTQQPIPCSSPMPAGKDSVVVPRAPLGAHISLKTQQPGHTVFIIACHRLSVFISHVLSSLLKLQKKPAFLFSVTAVATLTVATVISFVESHAVDQRSLLIVNSQKSPSAPSANQSEEGSGPDGNQGSMSELKGPHIPTVSLTQPVEGQVGGVIMQEETGADAAWRQSDPVPAVAVEVPLVVVVEHASSEHDIAKQPTANNNEAELEESVELASFTMVENLVLLPERFSSDGQRQGITPALSADATTKPAVDTEVTTVSNAAALTASTATNDSRQFSNGQETVVPHVSASESIFKLLSMASEALREDRLLIPEQHSAYIYYQQVLSLEPGNADAIGGLEQIVKRYVTLALYAIQRQDKIRANRYISRGLRVRPRDERLLALKNIISAKESVRVQPRFQAHPAHLEFAPEEVEEVELVKEVEQVKEVRKPKKWRRWRKR